MCVGVCVYVCGWGSDGEENQIAILCPGKQARQKARQHAGTRVYSLSSSRQTRKIKSTTRLARY